MRQRLAVLGLVLSTLLINGCDSVSKYRVSEQQINHSLASHLQFQQTLGLPGLASTEIKITQLHADIGQQLPGRILLTGRASANLRTLFGQGQANIDLQLSAIPDYRADEKALYLKDLNLLQAKAQPQQLQTVVDGVTPLLANSLREYFSQQPAYRLASDHSHGEALARRFAERITLSPGAVVFHLAL